MPPLFNILPLSLKGEGDKGGKGDKNSIVRLASVIGNMILLTVYI